MPVSRLLPPLLLLALLTAGCSAAKQNHEPPRDASNDTSQVDRMAEAPATLVDGASSMDASPADASPADASPADAPPADLPVLVDAGTVGLIGWWSLDESSGSSLAADRSGRGNHGTVIAIDVATAWRPGRLGGALEIPNRVGPAVSVGASASIDSIRAFTIAAWVNRKASVGSSSAVIMSRQIGPNGGEVYTLAFTGDALVVSLPRTSVRSSRTTPLNVWTHVAATWDGSFVRLYQDGLLVGSRAFSQQLPASTSPLLLGNSGSQLGLDQPLAGVIDEVRLYDRALSAADVQALARGAGS